MSYGGIRLTAPNAPGTYYYGACVDSVFGESNTGNNCSSAVEITVDALTVHPSLTGPVYWIAAGSNKIQRANPGDSNIETLFTTADGLKAPDDIVLDVSNGKMYWTDGTTGKVQCANLDGSNMEDLLTKADGLRSPESIALDVSNGKMYWTDGLTHKIHRANLDGNNVEDLVSGAYGRGLALDVSNSKMYWADRATNKIRRANLDGLNKEDFLTRADDNYLFPADIALDVSNRKIYWITYFAYPEIKCANLDGAEIKTLIRDSNMGHKDAIALDVSNGKIYWTVNKKNKIRRANLDGSGVVEDIVTGLDRPDSIALGISTGTQPSNRRPNLVVESPRASKTTLAPGDSFTLSVTVANKGTAESPATTLRYYRSRDKRITTSDTRVGGTNRVGGLGLPTGGRSTSERNITLPVPNTPGIYYYGACVDRVANESDPNNNCSEGVEITVEASDTHGDTRADATHLSIGIVRPGVIDFSKTLHAFIGTHDDIDYFRVEVTGAGRLTVYTMGDLNTVGYLQDSYGAVLANDDNAGDGNNFRIQRVVNSSTYYVKVQRRGGQTGAYTFHAHIDLDDPDSTADLVLELPWVGPSTLAPGESFEFGVTVKNKGDALSPATTLKYYRSLDKDISAAEDTEVDTGDVRRIAANGKLNYSTKLSAPDTPGTYYYGACVESVKNEALVNNNCSAGMKVTVAIKDDHGNTRAEATPLPLDGSLTGAIEIGEDIDYFSLEVSGPGDLTIYTTGALDTAGELQDSSGKSLEDDDDDGDGNNFRIQHTLNAGIYYIKVESYRSDTGNYTLHVNFLQRPDLVVSVRAESSDIAPGEEFKLYSTLKNQGEGQSAATTIRYYHLDDDTIDDTISKNDKQLGTGNRDPLPPDGTIKGRFTVTAPDTPGTYYYRVCVDHVANESDTTNNCSDVVSITVSPQTNAVVRVTPDSLTQGAGEPVTLKIDIADAKNVIGYKFTLAFDPSALEYLSSRDGGYLAGVEGKHVAVHKAKLTANSVTLGAANIQDYESTGAGTLGYVTFKVRQQGTSTLALSDVELTKKGGAVVYPRVEHGQVIGSALPSQQNIVRVIYFLPKDRSPQEDIDENLHNLIQGAQTFYAEQMREKNDGVRKTFTFETDSQGKAVVHHVYGKLTNDEYYDDPWSTIKSEIRDVFDTSKNLFFIAADLKSKRISGTLVVTCGLGGVDYSSYDSDRQEVAYARGTVLIPASGFFCFKNPNLTYHELGHAFGLKHDFRDSSYTMSYGTLFGDLLEPLGFFESELSSCAAEWLDASPFFNTSQPPATNQTTTIEMLPFSADSLETLRFEISDGDGLHQVQLIAAPTGWKPPSGYSDFPSWWILSEKNKAFLHACKRLEGVRDTFEFNTDRLSTDEVMLQVIDKSGNIVRQNFELRLDNHGDTAADATPLALNSSSDGEIAPGDDVDYFKIEVNSTGEMTVYTTGSLDTVGLLQDSSNATLVDDDDGGNNGNFLIEHSVEPGTFYVKVESYDVAIGAYTIHVEFAAISADVNGDGQVDQEDLVIVTANLGKDNATHAQGDVNGDGVVNLSDVAAVLEALEGAAAPTANSREMSTFTIEALQKWIDRAKQLNISDADFQKGIAVLEELLETLIETEKVPVQTALLANYPNSFNPETWIPYQLAKPADVTLTIYDIKGHVVRALDLGHQRAGIYHSRSRAAHWDGRNAQGEPVASGVYFYTLKAGDFSATRKMLIRK